MIALPFECSSLLFSLSFSFLAKYIAFFSGSVDWSKSSYSCGSNSPSHFYFDIHISPIDSVLGNTLAPVHERHYGLISSLTVILTSNFSISFKSISVALMYNFDSRYPARSARWAPPPTSIIFYAIFIRYSWS